MTATDSKAAAPAPAAPAAITRIMSSNSAKSGKSASLAAVQSATTDYSYPHGHLGHLNEKQELALEQFKEVLVERGYLKLGPPQSHDDTLLLRFLRARRWVVEEAYKQFKETEDWRKANDIEVLYKTIEVEAYEQSRRMYPQWTGRRDRRGIPLYVFEIRSLDSKTVSTYENHGANNTFSEAKTDGKTPSGMLRLFALYENLTRFNMPFSTQLTDREFPDVPITMSTNIVDISGVGLKQFWNLKSHMQAASQLATAHYPETLDRIFIIGAPMFFSTVWGWIKRWFDPITVSKIFVLSSSEVKPTLEAFIDPRNIPKKYGGELDFKFGQLSIPDPHWDGVVRWENGYTSFPTGPMLWEEIDGGERMRCYRLGRKDGVAQDETVCTVPKTFTLPVKPETNGVATEEPQEAGTTDKQDFVDAPEATVTEEKTNGTEPVTNGDALEKLKLDDTDTSDEKKAEADTAIETVPAPVQTAAA